MTGISFVAVDCFTVIQQHFRSSSLNLGFFSQGSLPVWGFSRTVGEFPRHQLLVALEGELGAHQEASVEVREAKNLQQRGHRRQSRALLL